MPSWCAQKSSECLYCEEVYKSKDMAIHALLRALQVVYEVVHLPNAITRYHAEQRLEVELALLQSHAADAASSLSRDIRRKSTPPLPK